MPKNKQAFLLNKHLNQVFSYQNNVLFYSILFIYSWKSVSIVVNSTIQKLTLF